MASNEPALDPTLYGSYEPYAPELPIVPAYMTAHMAAPAPGTAAMGGGDSAIAPPAPGFAAGPRPMTPQPAAQQAVAPRPAVPQWAVPEPTAPEPAADESAHPAPVPARAGSGGRHRVAKQRGGTMARSGAVLGVGVIAAVGAGGMASAQDRPAAPISVPDLAGVGSLLGGGQAHEEQAAAAAPGAEQPLTQAGLSTEEAAQGTTNAGEALRARILQQAEHQQNAADDQTRESTQREAAEAAAKKAAEAAEAEKAAKEAEAEKAKAARAESRPAAAEDAADPTDTGPRTPAAHSPGAYTLPVGSYTLTAGFGQAGNMWSANHTGEDFAAPTGTPVKAIGSGTITHAGWAGAYGYRIVLKLDDGTEVWFCHLSSMVVTSGKVNSGDVIGRVGATGNVTGPHLHLEIRPDGGAPVDPLPWLRERGLEP
ncbi:peptidoglycan DD-metalloendopeptidase family protein [Streptomyces sp. NPDC051173]|uniref:peptidoglycan DD-metalloendopeptidase family protein n=1 Tax=Streptomyces sp. NPDC051173 TaxID=3155164 RepID=UPI00344CD463